MKPRLYPVLLSVLFTVTAGAGDDQDYIFKSLEGRYVTVDLDMPATEKGVDLRFDKSDPFNSQEHFRRIRDCDIAIPRGERAQISRVHVKGDHIEFQLDGGGFDWITDATTRTFTPESKSNREKDLDREIKDETDRDRKRRLEDERDDLRRRRERHDERERREVEDYNVEAHRRDLERAVRSGSRFNLRFKKRIPPEAMSPEGVLRFLEPWVQMDDERRERRR